MLTKKKIKKNYKTILGTIIFIPLLLFLVYCIFFPTSFFESREAVMNYVENFGFWAPLIFVIIQILQVVLAPINGYTIGIAGGFIFGVWQGFLLNYIGRVIGHLIAFVLAQKLGRNLVKKIVKRKTLKKYDNFWEKGGSFLLFLIYYLPFFPDDTISYIAGTSKIKFKFFMIANIFGNIGGSLALAYIGAGMDATKISFYIIFFIVFIVALFLLYYWYKKYYPKFKK